jgi:hypothetical protein
LKLVQRRPSSSHPSPITLSQATHRHFFSIESIRKMPPKSRFCLLFYLLVYKILGTMSSPVPQHHATQLQHSPRSLQTDLSSPVHIALKQRTSAAESTLDSKTSPSKLLTIGIPLFCLFFLLLVFVSIKLSYLKHRRLQTIHDMPELLSEMRDFEYDANSLCSSSRVSPCPASDAGSVNIKSADKIRLPSSGGDNHSTRSRKGSKRSYNSEYHSSAHTGSSKRSRQNFKGSANALLVGLFGSPAWELSVQKQLAEHRWKSKIDSRKAAASRRGRHARSVSRTGSRSQSHCNSGSASQSRRNGKTRWKKIVEGIKEKDVHKA